MASDHQPPRSFSPGRKWSIGFGVLVSLAALFAIVVMVNYVSHNFFFRREFVSSRSRVRLSEQTRSFVRSLTNEVQITLYYDREDPLYSTIATLANEYWRANPKIKVTTVDYLADPAAAQAVKARYHLDGPAERNLLIVDCEGRYKKVNGDSLMEFSAPERVLNSREMEFRRRPVSFNGEVACSGMLLAVTSPKPVRVCVLTGHGEHPPAETEAVNGYAKFATVLMQNYLQPELLSLTGTNPVPADCAALIIAGPRSAIPTNELAKIARYLDDGGRLFLAVNYETAARDLGLERLLIKWGVNVTGTVVADPDNSNSGADVIVKSFSKHPVVSALEGWSVQLALPRQISRVDTGGAADAPKSEEIALTGPGSLQLNDTNAPVRAYPVAVVVEKGAVAGVTAGKLTRIVVIGDSLAFNNQMIDAAANRDLARSAVNWLTDRSQLLPGLGPRPVHEFRMLMTRKQWISASVVLLVGFPGAMLIVGGLVWLRRRK